MLTLEDKTFIFLIAAVSVAFAWILWPYYGAVLWGTVIAIVFVPLYRRLLRRMGQRRTLAALVTVLIILVMVILPLTLLVSALIGESAGLYQRLLFGRTERRAVFRADRRHPAGLGRQSAGPL